MRRLALCQRRTESPHRLHRNASLRSFRKEEAPRSPFYYTHWGCFYKWWHRIYACCLQQNKTRGENKVSWTPQNLGRETSEKAGSEDDGSHTPRPHDDACITLSLIAASNVHFNSEVLIAASQILEIHFTTRVGAPITAKAVIKKRWASEPKKIVKNTQWRDLSWTKSGRLAFLFGNPSAKVVWFAKRRGSCHLLCWDTSKQARIHTIKAGLKAMTIRIILTWWFCLEVMCFKTLSQSQSLIINEISFASLHLLEYLFPGLTAGVVCCDCIFCTLELDLCTLASDGCPSLIFALILIALSIALGKYESWCSCNTVSWIILSEILLVHPESYSSLQHDTYITYTCHQLRRALL